MEKDSTSKPSVAELAGKLKGHILPMPNSNDESSFRRRPPCSLKLQNQTNDIGESDKPMSSSPFKKRTKNSAIIEKLQANLALSPTTLLPSPKSPEVKPPPAPPSPPTPRSPLSPLSPTLRLPRLSSEEEDPVSFESPPEGTPLPSFNKTRARLSFKRRPPTRQHRRSAGEEVGAAGSDPSPCELQAPTENGSREQVFDDVMEEAEYGQRGGQRGAENKDADYGKPEADVRSDPHDKAHLEQEEQKAMSAEALEEEPKPEAEKTEHEVKADEGQTCLETHCRENNGV